MKFVPGNTNVSGINIDNDVLYAATRDDCGGHPNSLYALDLSQDNPSVVSHATNGSGFAGLAGTAVGSDNVVYVQVPDGHDDKAGDLNDTVLALDPKTLEVKDYFTPEGESQRTKKNIPQPGATPVVFEWKGKEMIVARRPGWPAVSAGLRFARRRKPS